MATLLPGDLPLLTSQLTRLLAGTTAEVQP
jgi:hypothetical protein